MNPSARVSTPSADGSPPPRYAPGTVPGTSSSGPSAQAHKGFWHVAVVVENVPLGVDTRLRKQVDELLAAGFEVSVVTRRHPDNDMYRGRPGLRLLEHRPPPDGSGPLGYAREYATAFAWAALLLGRLRLRRRIDVLQLCQPPDIYFPLARVLSWTGTRVVVDQRDLMPEVFRSRYDDPPAAVEKVLRLLERRTQRVADATITVSDFLATRLQQAGAREADTFVVWNGPVLSRAERAEPDEALRGGHAAMVVWIGKMGRQDRVDLVLDVAERVVRTHGRTDVLFRIVGDGECLDELRADASARGLDEWVVFPGWVTEAEVFGHLATADLGIDTSLQEEVAPVKAMEYMAHGLPFVGFDLRETRALSRDAAVLVAPGDVDAAAEAVLRLLDDRAQRDRLGEAGHRRVRDELAWEHQAQTYIAALTQGLSPR
jgi:glycosyltransferase involved in cell wall biosynthesis